MPQPLYLCIHLRDFAALALTHAGTPNPAAGAPPSPSLGKGGIDGHEGAPPLLSLGRGGIEKRAALRPRSPAVAVLSGDPPLERVFALNSTARRLGLAVGMSRLQAESFPAALLRRNRPQEELAFAALMHCAQRFSPRIEIVAAPQEESCAATLLLDVSSSGRLLGSAPQIASAAHHALGELGCGTASEAVSVAVAHNACAALLAARGIPGAMAIAPGCEATTLGPLPLWVLEPGEEQAQTLADWGIHTLGQLAALPARALAARLGQSGLRLQSQARGHYSHLLLPTAEPADAPLCAGIELEQPVELLEPLLFLLNQLLEQVLARAAQRSLAIAAVELCLVLDGSGNDGCPTFAAPFAAKVGGKNARIAGGTRKPVVGLSGAVDVVAAPHPPAFARCEIEDRRTIRPALPERDRIVLLKLIQLELETHPPTSAVVALRIVAHPARPQTAQQGLFEAQAPEPGRMEILLARLRKLVGEGRVGSPELLDSHATDAVRMTRFAPQQRPEGDQPVPQRPEQVPHICPLSADEGEQNSAGAAETAETAAPSQRPALRMVRPPREVAIELCRGAPVAMRYEGQRHIVQAASGPWRTSGAWWTHPAWCREEWEIFLHDEAPQNGGFEGAPSSGRCGNGGGIKSTGGCPTFAAAFAAKVGEQNGGIKNSPPPPRLGTNAGSAAPQENASSLCLRLAHDPANGGWYVIGIYD